eukprot:1152897-Pelagomonas_calceolata.AAC.8
MQQEAVKRALRLKKLMWSMLEYYRSNKGISNAQRILWSLDAAEPKWSKSSTQTQHEMGQSIQHAMGHNTQNAMGQSTKHVVGLCSFAVNGLCSRDGTKHMQRPCNQTKRTADGLCAGEIRHKHAHAGIKEQF